MEKGVIFLQSSMSSGQFTKTKRQKFFCELIYVLGSCMRARERCENFPA